MTRSVWRRGLAVLLGAVLVATVAVGPSRLAGAVGMRSSTTVASGYQPGFLPEAHSVEVSSPTVRLYGLKALDPNTPIPLAGGTSSPPDTLLIVASAIELDDLRIVQNGVAGLEIDNPGLGADGGLVGTPGKTTFYLWGQEKSLCIDIAGVISLVTGYLPGGGSVLAAILSQLTALSRLGPCVPLRPLKPLLHRLLEMGIALPSPIIARDLDIDVFALRIDSSGANTVSLPHGVITVGSS